MRAEARTVQDEAALGMGFKHQENWTEVRATDCLFNVSGSQTLRCGGWEVGQTAEGSE